MIAGRPTVEFLDVEMFDCVIGANSNGSKDELSLKPGDKASIQRADAFLTADDVDCAQ